MNNKKLAIIVAIATNGVIGNEDPSKALPWAGKLRRDMNFFTETTTGNGNNAVVTARKTKDTIPPKYFPLKNRKNLILTRQKDLVLPDGVEALHSIGDILDYHANGTHDMLFSAGGAEAYRQLLPEADVVYVTRVHAEVDGDVFLPELDEELKNGSWKLESSEFYPAEDKTIYDLTFEKWVRA